MTLNDLIQVLKPGLNAVYSTISSDGHVGLGDLLDQINGGGGGSGDVAGPSSSGDSAFAIFDGITGKLLKNSVLTYEEDSLSQMTFLLNTIPVLQMTSDNGADKLRAPMTDYGNSTSPNAGVTYGFLGAPDRNGMSLGPNFQSNNLPGVNALQLQLDGGYLALGSNGVAELLSHFRPAGDNNFVLGGAGPGGAGPDQGDRWKNAYLSNYLLVGLDDGSSNAVYIDGQHTHPSITWKKGGSQVEVTYDGTVFTIPGALVANSLGSSNTVAATTLGSVIKKVPYTDGSGAVIGYLALYNHIDP